MSTSVVGTIPVRIVPFQTSMVQPPPPGAMSVPGTLTRGVAPYTMLYEQASMRGVATSGTGAVALRMQMVVCGNEASQRVVPNGEEVQKHWCASASERAPWNLQRTRRPPRFHPRRCPHAPSAARLLGLDTRCVVRPWTAGGGGWGGAAARGNQLSTDSLSARPWWHGAGPPCCCVADELSNSTSYSDCRG